MGTGNENGELERGMGMGTGNGKGEWERGMGTGNGNREWERGMGMGMGTGNGNGNGEWEWGMGIRGVTTGNILKEPKLHLCRLIMHPRYANSLRTRAKTVRFKSGFRTLAMLFWPIFSNH